LTPSPGEIWLADRGDEPRRFVFVISDARSQASPKAVAVNQFGTTPVDRLLERVDRAGFETLRQVRRAVREITT
jgi:hypothetical protein